MNQEKIDSLIHEAFWYGHDSAKHKDRVAAFGAIRRAAEMVRGWELDAGREHVLIDSDEAKWSWHLKQRDTRLLQAISGRMLIREAIGSLPHRILHHHGDTSERTLARGIRRATRAAIGSEKA